MATILRPPLTYSPQGKQWRGMVDSYPNLTNTTLAPLPALNLPLRAIRWDMEAPLRRHIRAPDVYPNLVLSILPPADTTNAPAFADFDEVPAKRFQASVDVFPNLSVTTLAIAPTFVLPLSALKLDGSAPRAKRISSPDTYPNLIQTTFKLLTTYQPPLSSEEIDWSAPPKRSYNEPDIYPNVLANVLQPTTIPLPLSALRVDQSAPQVKKPVYIDQPLYRPITLNPVPQFLKLDQSAPPPKKQVFAEQYINSGVLYPPWNLPLRHGDSFNSYKMKYEVRSDIYPNMVLLGIAEAPVAIIPEPAKSRTINVGGRRSILVKAPRRIQ